MVEDFCCLASVNNRCACKRTHLLYRKGTANGAPGSSLQITCFVAFFWEGVAIQPSGGSPLWPESHRHPAVSASQGLET